METRRDFLKKVAMLSAAAGGAGVLPPSIQKAFAINPAVGSTYLDAEHVVILMQENRSFDHSYGTLQGVRGFNDPRAITLPNKNKVWLQTNAAGETYAPFRLNMKDTKATWMGSLPHSWTNQVDARNGGRCDQWLIAKPSGEEEYKDMPLTLGHYNREDLPFYYALADAFTVCDQNFCSSLTGTTPNRLYLWTGTIRENVSAQARVRNEELDYDRPAQWTTFPERLEERGVSWKIYQNELSVGAGFEGEEDSWLSNFTDNPIEWFSQYHVKFSQVYIKHLPAQIEKITHEIAAAEKKLQGMPAGEEAKAFASRIERGKTTLAELQQDLKTLTPEAFAKIPEREKSLHRKAFTTNSNDPDYHTLTTAKYEDGGTVREMKVPKGDVLHQFRQDVKNGTLPAVSWLVAPENFSDHPGAPWYGAWYVSETLDILTQNPEVWKKTIFILAYDENDGYFDHVPPFVPPHPTKPNTGKLSPGLDANIEYVTMAQELKRKPAADSRESSIGLGYRVPLVIASPWSRGGAVCSQVFDHTSVIQFLEKFVSHKTGKPLTETNITAWRRAVCGDLTSSFIPYNGETFSLPPFVNKESFIEGVHKAQFKQLPAGFQKITAEEAAKINNDPSSSALMPQQEKGTRTSRPLPYQLYAHGKLSEDRKSIVINFDARTEKFGAASSGSPFHVYSHGKTFATRAYAVSAGKPIADTWMLTDFGADGYDLHVYGPNGFYRTFKGTSLDPSLEVTVDYSRAGKEFNGNVDVLVVNKSKSKFTIDVKDWAYQNGTRGNVVQPGGKLTTTLDLTESSGWYDFSVLIREMPGFERRFAGRVETGRPGTTDPLIGR
ncbi:phosphocholine-specific phospholipase C [Chryseolinea lacunae]|uniref:phospholipase C n=1 Tax=Chryseolinea lacunae TaxID=2801331 RepID=A0ABS1KYN2_9BACT|nr:phospholipase C, phosphocholine-specific [Chryseolinea lacunae]MBL0744362.1 phospholipase C, phosphocholine-specific [Chryseolinea lacunae]